jgi:hypothetical protein
VILYTFRLCSIARRNGESSFIDVKSEETGYFEFGNPSLHQDAVTKVKLVVANHDEPAEPYEGRGFAEWAMLVLHALRIELGKSYRGTIDSPVKCQVSPKRSVSRDFLTLPSSVPGLTVFQ